MIFRSDIDWHILGVFSGLSVTVLDVVLIPARTIAKTSSGKIQRQQCKANCIKQKGK